VAVAAVTGAEARAGATAVKVGVVVEVEAGVTTAEVEAGVVTVMAMDIVEEVGGVGAVTEAEVEVGAGAAGVGVGVEAEVLTDQTEVPRQRGHRIRRGRATDEDMEGAYLRVR